MQLLLLNQLAQTARQNKCYDVTAEQVGKARTPAKNTDLVTIETIFLVLADTGMAAGVIGPRTRRPSRREYLQSTETTSIKS